MNLEYKKVSFFKLYKKKNSSMVFKYFEMHLYIFHRFILTCKQQYTEEQQNLDLQIATLSVSLQAYEYNGTF